MRACHPFPLTDTVKQPMIMDGNTLPHKHVMSFGILNDSKPFYCRYRYATIAENEPFEKKIQRTYVVAVLLGLGFFMPADACRS